MTIRLTAVSPYHEDETEITLAGVGETELTSMLASRLLLADYELLIEDDEGEWVPFADFALRELSEDE